MTDKISRLRTGPQAFRAGAPSGPLAGLRFAAKDLLDVAGHVTGGGNPDWRATHGPAAADAVAIARLVRAGATLWARRSPTSLPSGWTDATRMTERRSMPPPRAACPAALPAVRRRPSAAGLVAFALGTDTGGSVRVPASFCGLFGFRPSHGAVPTEGVIPFAPSLDTVGWFARDADLLRRVGQVLLADAPVTALPGRAALVRDGFGLADPAVQARCAPAAELALSACGMPAPAEVAMTEDGLAGWLDAYRIIQGSEIDRALGPWIRQTAPRFGANVAPRFASVRNIPPAQAAAAGSCRAAVRARLDAMLRTSVLVLPTAPVAPPPRDIPEAALGLLYPRLLALAAPAGLAGCRRSPCRSARSPAGRSGFGDRSARQRPCAARACRCYVGGVAGSAAISWSDPVTKPKHFFTFQTVASVQKSGEVVPQQSSTRMQP